MNLVKSYVAHSAGSELVPWEIERRTLQPFDVLIEIDFCGICYSDLNKVRNVRGDALFPMVPGHEITGRIVDVGNKVTRFRLGDFAGVGCLVDSCRQCEACVEGDEPYCEVRKVPTYNGHDKYSGGHTFGGYSTHIVVDENYGFKIPTTLPLDAAAPLLCAGSTAYAALRHWNAGTQKKIAVVGLGGIGHLAVKLARAFGADVTVFSHSKTKREDALRFGATAFCDSTDFTDFQKHNNTYELVLNTVSTQIDWNAYLNLLKRDGSLVNLGMPAGVCQMSALNLISKRRTVSGTLYGGIQETQQMLEFCATKQVYSEIEKLPIQEINHAFRRLEEGKPRYRYVIDMASLKSNS